jgi:hypothetical protein
MLKVLRVWIFGIRQLQNDEIEEHFYNVIPNKCEIGIFKTIESNGFFKILLLGIQFMN